MLAGVVVVVVVVLAVAFVVVVVVVVVVDVICLCGVMVVVVSCCFSNLFKRKCEIVTAKTKIEIMENFKIRFHISFSNLVWEASIWNLFQIFALESGVS